MYAMPRALLPSGRKKHIATAVVGVWILVALFWNLLAAHYRDAKYSGVPDYDSASLRLMFESPISLASIYSWALFLAGVSFAAIAARSAFKSDDPYPDYGETDRRHNLRCELYSMEIEEATEELGEIRNSSIAEARSIGNELKHQLSTRDAILVYRADRVKRFYEHAAQLEQTANALLEIYRFANRQSRTDPVPSHFDVRWELPVGQLPASNLHQIEIEDIKDTERELEAAINEIVDAYNDAISSFEPLEILKQRLAND